MLDTGFWPNWKRVPFDLTRQFVLQMPQHKVLRSRTAYRSRNREPDFLAFLDNRLTKEIGHAHLTILGSPRVEYESALALAIDVLSVSNFHHDHYAFFVLDRVDDAIPPLPHSVAILSSKFFTAMRTRFTCQRFDTTENLSQVFLGDAFEILLNRCFENEAICGHLF
jgi:hypothetical protein